MNKYRRSFVDDQLVIDSFESVEKYLTLLLDRNLDSTEALRQWLIDKSELEAVLEEDMAWRYIRMSIDTANEEFQKAYTFFVTEVQPKLAPIDDALNKKFIACPFHTELEKEEAFAIHIRSVKSQLELYRGRKYLNTILFGGKNTRVWCDKWCTKYRARWRIHNNAKSWIVFKRAR